MGHRTFERGIHPSYYKELTSGKRVEPAALPRTVVIPLQQHAGTPCEPLVKKGESVQEGQKIADVKAFVSAPVHASISGKVKDIELANHPNGYRCASVIIEGDGLRREWGTGTKGVDVGTLQPEAVRQAIREAGIVGMGGAAFPSSVKLAPPKGRAVDTVILNGCECEPFLTADHRIMAEEPEKVVWGLKALMRASGASKGFIGIEENKPDAIEALAKAVSGSPEIKIIVLEAKYPQGAEKMLISAAVGRKVPPGKLPFDVGVLVNNVGTAVAVFEALNWGKPLFERVVTISGNGVREPKNLKVRVGTLFEEVIAQCGGLVGKELEVLNGGPMMGNSQSTLAVPVTKGTTGITVISADEIRSKPYEPCIKCASCVEVCPMGLMPYRLGDYGKLQMTAEFSALDGLSCIECGCCSYVCPAKRPLIQWIRVGKLRLRQEARKAQGAK
ncbi:MAG: electron transport complex subunit RsxC [Thermodesulfobacteriota bacterium]|nr:MAG: electron transport complex subunit RsxC [Thermodesulfobacteriota bacterium]